MTSISHRGWGTNRNRSYAPNSCTYGCTGDSNYRG